MRMLRVEKWDTRWTMLVVPNELNSPLFALTCLQICECDARSNSTKSFSFSSYSGDQSSLPNLHPKKSNFFISVLLYSSDWKPLKHFQLPFFQKLTVVFKIRVNNLNLTECYPRESCVAVHLLYWGLPFYYKLFCNKRMTLRGSL